MIRDERVVGAPRSPSVERPARLGFSLTYSPTHLLFLTALAAALRAWNLGAQSLWLDELFSVLVARRDWVNVIEGTIQGDTNPPLFHFLLHLALQFGVDEIAARAVSLVFSVAAIPLFYLLARRLIDARVALVAAFLLALNPFHILFAQEARMYAQLAFFVLAAQYFFVRAWQEGQARDWTLFAFSMTLAFYSHSLAVLNLLAVDGFAVTQRAMLPTRWRALLLSHAAIALAFAPWLAVFLQQAARVQSGFWSGAPSPLAFFTTPYLFLFANTVPILLVPLALFAGLALIAFALFAAFRSSSGSLLFPVFTFGFPLCALYLLSFARPIFVERTLLPASFGLYLLLAWGVIHSPPRKLIVALAVILIAIQIASITNYQFQPAVQKPPFRDAARMVAEQFQPGDIVAHTSDSSALAFLYYAPQLPSYFLAGDPDYAMPTIRASEGRTAGLVPREADAITRAASRVWLVVALDHNEDYQKVRVAEFDAHFRRVRVQSVGGIDLVLYGSK